MVNIEQVCSANPDLSRRNGLDTSCREQLPQGRARSIVEITPSQLQRFTVSMKELAEWFGRCLKCGCQTGVGTGFSKH